MRVLLNFYLALLALTTPLYADCITYTPVTVNFQFDDPKYNIAQILLQSKPTLTVSGTKHSLRSLERSRDGSYDLDYCISSESRSAEDMSFSLGERNYPDLQLLEGDDGLTVAIFETNTPELGFVTDIEVSYRARINRVGISFNVHNTQNLGLTSVPTITLKWSTDTACGSPQPVERQFIIGLYQGVFDLTETVGDRERSRNLLPASAGANLEGDYCSEEGVTFVIKSAPLEFDPDFNSQRVLVDIELSEGARELLDVEGLTLRDWAIEFGRDAFLAKKSYLSPPQCAAEYSLLEHSRPTRLYFNGESDEISVFAVRNAEYLTQIRWPFLVAYSKETLGTSPEVEVTYSNNAQCFDGPHIQDGKINFPPLFLELLMLKSEDAKIAEQLLERFVDTGALIFGEGTEGAEDLITCSFALLNMNHRRYAYSPGDICSSAFNDFYDIWRGLRTSGEEMAGVAAVYRDALEFALAHEYGHFALGHLDDELTKEQEIEADLFAYRYIANAYGESYALAVMKMFFSTYANFLDLTQDARAQFAAAQDVAFMQSSLETDRYLTSECRAFETLKAAGVEGDILAELEAGSETLVQVVGSDIIEELTDMVGIDPIGLLARCN